MNYNIILHTIINLDQFLCQEHNSPFQVIIAISSKTTEKERKLVGYIN